MNRDLRSLSTCMRALATERDDLPDGFLEAAEKLETAREAFCKDSSPPAAKKLFAAFTHANRLWCEATGDSLI